MTAAERAAAEATRRVGPAKPGYHYAEGFHAGFRGGAVWQAEQQRTTTEEALAALIWAHPTHNGHEFGGAYARAAALSEGDPDWMNATGGSPEAGAPVVDREALVGYLALDQDEMGYVTMPLDGLVDSIIASGIVRDAREVRAEVIDWIADGDSSPSIERSVRNAREHFGIEDR